MSYIGNQPLYTSFVTDTFSGNGSQITFTLSIAPANAASILVAIGGILQSPSAYGVVGQQLTFTGIPPTGTNNISVRYLGLPASNVITPAYRTVTEITATAGQKIFNPASYTPGFIDVFRNGVRLAAEDYTATNGAQVVLVNPAVAGDTITLVGFYVSSVLNAIPANAGVINSGYLANGAVGTAALDVGNFNGTGGMALPSGTTAQRPASPTVGMHRWNTSLGAMEVYVGGGTGWQSIASTAYTIDYLIVAGGGGGGTGNGTIGNEAGGGGAGGMLQGFSISVNPGTSYTITVGGGGATNTQGGPSSGFGTTAIGGGYGGNGGQAGGNGGSGGGGSHPQTAGGSGTAGQGSNGAQASSASKGAGGGGAGGPGGTSFGGIGLQSSITGTATYYAGGGAGNYPGTSQSGGLGGGGGAPGPSQTAGSPGTNGLGGGGGGSNSQDATRFGGAGGSGIVIVRYAGSSQRATGGNSIVVSGGYVVHTFTSSGAFVA